MTLLSITKYLEPPNDREQTLKTFLDAVKLDITMGKPKTIHDNLTATERQVMR